MARKAAHIERHFTLVGLERVSAGEPWRVGGAEGVWVRADGSVVESTEMLTSPPAGGDGGPPACEADDTQS